jgi:hypothetical protein
MPRKLDGRRQRRTLDGQKGSRRAGEFPGPAQCRDLTAVRLVDSPLCLFWGRLPLLNRSSHRR